MLALPGPARRWEPRRLRLRIFACAGRIARGGRRLRLRLPPPGPGPPTSPPRSPGCTPWHPADQAPAHPCSAKGTPRARGTPPTRRDSRANRHHQTLKRRPAISSGQAAKITKDRG
jgi:hypothetical protein